jgi:hypothetical protein
MSDAAEITIDDIRLPDNIRAAIDAAPLRDVVNINGDVIYPDKIIKTNQLVFGPHSTLTFTNLSGPRIIIAADRLTFVEPGAPVAIRRDPTLQPQDKGDEPEAPSGVAGQDFADLSAQRDGEDGQPGRPAESGGDGMDMPDLWIVVAGRLDSPGSRPSLVNLTIDFTGVDGGRGGNGGSGGRGGNGGHGREGRLENMEDPGLPPRYFCAQTPTDGGDGGDGGRGGRGGNGGHGGRGSNITLVGPAAANDVLVFSRIVNHGGEGGDAGRNGRSGDPGLGGRKGRRVGSPCPERNAGRDGTVPLETHQPATGLSRAQEYGRILRMDR